MINILAHIVKIIVLSSSSDALLSVNHSHPLGHVTVGIHSAEEYRLELFVTEIQRKIINITKNMNFLKIFLATKSTRIPR